MIKIIKEVDECLEMLGITDERGDAITDIIAKEFKKADVDNTPIWKMIENINSHLLHPNEVWFAAMGFAVALNDITKHPLVRQLENELDDILKQKKANNYENN
jgi:hypothetical protein